MIAAAVAVAALLVLFGVRWLRARPEDRAFLTLRPLLARGIERRLGPYRQRVVEPEADRPERHADGRAPRSR
ncbi:MAG: hypothetical protein R3B09_20200 [Nannocystaceae bacterium]